MANQVTLTFGGDARSLDRAFDNVGKGAKDLAQDVDKASDRLGNFGDTLDGSSGGLRNGKDVLDGFGDSMEALGATLPGPIGNVAMFAGGVADMADGLGGLLAPALARAKGAMLALNATIAANPIGFAVLAIAALTAGFVIAYKKSETFRNIVHGAMDGARKAIGWVVDKGEELLGWFKSAPGKIASTLSGVAKIITAPYRTAFNLIADAWNNTVGRLSFSVPGWVPGLGGKGWDVPDIPKFANGGRTTAGPMIVGERGPEVFVPDVPGHVITTNQMRGGSGGAGAINLTINQYDEAGTLRQQIQRIVRIDGAGNVQTALGSG